MQIVEAQLQQMAIQMAALDEFVTRAREQNNRHHAERVQRSSAISQMVVASAQTSANELIERQRQLAELSQQSEQDTSNLEALVSPFTDDTRGPLAEVPGVMHAWMMREYQPTGATPQKREWTLPTSLPRTESHDVLVARLRGLPLPETKTASGPASHTPGRLSPRKFGSPRKLASPTRSKLPSPSKTKVFTDAPANHAASQTPTIAPTSGSSSAPVAPSTTARSIGGSSSNGVSGGLKEVDINIATATRAPPGPGAPCPPPFFASGASDDSVLHQMAYGKGGQHDSGTAHAATSGMNFSKSVSSVQPPAAKRHATAAGVVRGAGADTDAASTLSTSTSGGAGGTTNNNANQPFSRVPSSKVVGAGGGISTRGRTVAAAAAAAAAAVAVCGGALLSDGAAGREKENWTPKATAAASAGVSVAKEMEMEMDKEPPFSARSARAPFLSR